MSLVSAMNVEQNKGWICGLRFGLTSADEYMEMLRRKNNLMKGKPHLTLQRIKYLNEKLERLVEE